MLRGDLRQLGSVLGQVAVTLDDFGAAEPAAIVRGAAEAVMPGALLGVEVGTGGDAARSRRHLEEVLGATPVRDVARTRRRRWTPTRPSVPVAELDKVVEDRDAPAASASTGGPAPSAPSGAFGAD